MFVLAQKRRGNGRMNRFMGRVCRGREEGGWRPQQIRDSYEGIGSYESLALVTSDFQFRDVRLFLTAARRRASCFRDRRIQEIIWTTAVRRVAAVQRRSHCDRGGFSSGSHFPYFEGSLLVF